MMQDIIMASSAKEIEQPNNENNTHSDEEFDQSNSMLMDGEGKQKMAELEDKARLLQAQFEVENIITIERIKNIREELKVSQEKEATITQKCEETETRNDALSEDMRLLEKKSVEGEMLERKERKKIRKEKRKVELKLNKIRAKKSAPTATLGREEIENEMNDNVALKEPRSSEEAFVHSDDESIQIKDALKHKASVTTVVSISEQLLQEELLNAFKAATAVQSTKVYNAISYVKGKSAEIVEMNDEVSFEQGYYHKELNRMKEEQSESEVSHEKEACCKSRESYSVLLEEAAPERNNFLTDIVEFTNKENEKLQTQVAAMREETKVFEIKNQSLQTELETVKLELKRLTFSGLAAKKESENKMVIYAEEMKRVFSKRKEKKRKHEIRKLRKEKGDLEEELLSTKRHLSRKVHELDQTKEALTLMTETTEALKQRVLEMENCLDYFFDNSSTLNSDISSIPDDCDLNDSVSSLVICSAEEVSILLEEKEEAGHEELSFDKDVQAGSKGLSIEELKAGSKEMTSQTDEETSASLLTKTAEEGSKAVETQLAHLYQILKGSLKELQELKTTLGRRQESWKTKKYERMVDEVAWLGDELYAKDNHLEALRYESIEIIANRDATIERLEGELVNARISYERMVDEVTWLGDELYAKDNQLEALRYESIEMMADRDDTIKRLEGELENARISLKQITEVLEHTEEKLLFQTSLLTCVEARHKDTLKEREGDLESTQTLLKEKTEALERIEGKLRLQVSLLANEESKHQDFVKQLQEDLHNTHISLEEKKRALEETEGELQLQKSVFASTEGTYEDIIKQLQEELQNMNTLLKEKTDKLEKTEAKLKLQTSFFDSTESQYEDIIKQLQEELERVYTLSKERLTALEQTQARLEICLNETNQDSHTENIRSGAVELTQDELELVFAELARAKREKAKLLQEATDATERLKLEKRTARKDKDVLWELFNAALRELEAKTQLIEDLKMNITESRIQASRINSEKREMQEYDNNCKQSTKTLKYVIGSIKQKNHELRSQNQKLLQSTDGMTQDEEDDSPSRPLTVRGVI